MAGTATVAFPASIGRNGALAATLRRSGDDVTANRRIMPARYAHGVMTAASPTAIRSPYGAPIWSGGFAVALNATDCDAQRWDRRLGLPVGCPVQVLCGLPDLAGRFPLEVMDIGAMSSRTSKGDPFGPMANDTTHNSSMGGIMRRLFNHLRFAIRGRCSNCGAYMSPHQLVCTRCGAF